MKKVLVFVAVATFLALGSSSCTKCYVCKEKTGTTFIKTKYCDKDFDKGDIDDAIRDAEDAGYTCHAESMIL